MSVSVHGSDLKGWVLPIGSSILAGMEVLSKDSLVKKAAICGLVFFSQRVLNYYFGEKWSQISEDALEDFSLSSLEAGDSESSMIAKNARDSKTKEVWEDFKLINNWKLDEKGPKWQSNDFNAQEEPRFVVDEFGRRYLNEPCSVIRFKCALLIVGTPFIHTSVAVVSVFKRVFKLVEATHFWEIKRESTFASKIECIEAKESLLKILASPFAVLGLEFAAIYGIIAPYDGRKLYASIERVQYGRPILAPCFQPDPKRHLLGGNINQKVAF